MLKEKKKEHKKKVKPLLPLSASFPDSPFLALFGAASYWIGSIIPIV